MKKLTEAQERYYAIVEKTNTIAKDTKAIAKVIADGIDLEKTKTASCVVYMAGIGLMSNHATINALASAMALSSSVSIAPYIGEDGKIGGVVIHLWVKGLLDDGEPLSKTSIANADYVLNKYPFDKLDKILDDVFGDD